METIQNLIDQVNAGQPVAMVLYAVVMVTGITGIVWAGAAKIERDSRHSGHGQDRRGAR